MAQELLTERHAKGIAGVVNCYDRIVISGQLQSICYAKGMTKYLYAHGVRIFDYTQFAEPLRDEIRQNAAAVAKAHGIEIEFISKVQNFRKEDRIQAIVENRGSHPGLVHIFSAMEGCASYQPWYDKIQEKAYVKSDQGKCLHYYFYFIDAVLGLCYLRVPTWCPFRLQFYCNGHNGLACGLAEQGIDFEQADNAFLAITDFDQANQMAADFNVERLHRTLDAYAAAFCPVAQTLKMGYTWSLMQVEYATDIVFHNQTVLQQFYPHLLETLIQAVKPADIATFLGRKLQGNYQDEMGNRFNKRWLGTRLKHTMGPVSIKLYDKFNIVLRIETTVNDVSFFSHYRQVQHRDGTTSTRYAPMKKTIYSLSPLAQTLQAVHQRYLKFISQFDTPDGGADNLRRLTETQIVDNRRYKGFNLLNEEDSSLFRSLACGEYTIQGFSNRRLRLQLQHLTQGQITRLLQRLRVHGLIKRAGKSYRYYLTDFGRRVVCLALKLRELVAIPSLVGQFL